MKKSRLLFFALLLAAAVIPLRALDPAPVLLDESAGTVCLSDRVGVLEDRTGKLTYEDILKLTNGFTPHLRRSFNFGYTRSAFWIKGALKSTTGENPSRWVLETRFPWFSSFDLYLTGPDGKTVHTSQVKKQPFRTRALPNRNFAFPLDLKTGTTRFLIRVTGTPLHFYLKTSPNRVFLDRAQTDSVIMGVYYGFILIVIGISFVLYLRIRERAYISNILFMASIGLLQFTLNGLAFQYLWPDALDWHKISTDFLPALSIFLGTVMCRYFLGTRKNMPVMDKILYVFQAVCVLNMIFAVLQMQTACLVLLNILMIGIPTFFIAMGVVCLKKGFYPARYFILTFIQQDVLLVVYALREHGILPHNALTEYSIQAAILMQVFFLLLAMLDRVNLSAKEKQKLEQELRFNLEKQVRDRTFELEKHATTDPMTGVYNRRIGLLFLEEEIHKAKRNMSVLTVCFVDIDNLKGVNDSFGHREGDELILQVVAAFRDSLRETDIVCRMGGDEFLIIMTNCNLNQSLEVWEGIQKRIAEKNRAILKSYNISVSRGFAEFNPLYPVTLDELITTADYQMYQHKKKTAIP